MRGLKNLQLFMVYSTAIISLSFSSAHAVMSTDLSLSDSTVPVGATFTLDVAINDAFDGLDPLEEVLAFGFNVSIDNPALVSFGGVSVAAPFNDDSAFFPATDVAGSVFPGIANEGTNDTIQLATLSFQALDVGSTSLEIFSDTLDLNEGLIYFLSDSADINASTTITIVGKPDAVVPEPSTFALVTLGLLFSAVVYKRQKQAYC